MYISSTWYIFIFIPAITYDMLIYMMAGGFYRSRVECRRLHCPLPFLKAEAHGLGVLIKSNRVTPRYGNPSHKSPQILSCAIYLLAVNFCYTTKGTADEKI
jgi:hypothetical protein